MYIHVIYIFIYTVHYVFSKMYIVQYTQSFISHAVYSGQPALPEVPYKSIAYN